MLNLAVEPDRPFWLRCPYDADALPAEIVEAAHHSHPVLVEAGDYRGSTNYGGVVHAEEMFGEPLPEPSVSAASYVFDGMTVTVAVKHAATEGAELARHHPPSDRPRRWATRQQRGTVVAAER